VRVRAILFAGNHRTVERALRAELSFHEGDSLDVADLAARLEVNRRRIYNLQLFHAVLVQASCGGTGQLTILFSVQERWYVLPAPIFSLADDFNVWRTRPDRWRRLDYGLHLVDTNFRGRAEQLTANVQFGFNRKFELLYEAPGLGRRRRIGLGMAVSYYQSRNLDYNVLGDRRISLPAAEEDAFPIQRFYASGGLRLRHTVQLSSSFDFSYHHEQVSNLIYNLNSEYLLGQPQRQYLEASFFTTNNQRNTFAYPLTGQFLQGGVSFRQFLGEVRSPGYLTLRLRYARYLSLGHQLYYAGGLNAATKLFASELGQNDARLLGADGLVRGYDYYVVEGRTFGVVQQGLSWRAFAPPPVRLPFINNPKVNTLPLAIYLNAFADAGFTAGSPVPRPPVAAGLPAANRLPGQLLASVGLGVHFVTYYDRVFCIELTRTLTVYPALGFFLRTSFPI
jgi:outer membrane protein assembly factor BamA